MIKKTEGQKSFEDHSVFGTCSHKTGIEIHVNPGLAQSGFEQLGPRSIRDSMYTVQ